MLTLAVFVLTPVKKILPKPSLFLGIDSQVLVKECLFRVRTEAAEAREPRPDAAQHVLRFARSLAAQRRLGRVAQEQAPEIPPLGRENRHTRALQLCAQFWNRSPRFGRKSRDGDETAMKRRDISLGHVDIFDARLGMP